MPNAHEIVDCEIRRLRSCTLSIFLEEVDGTIVENAGVERFRGFMDEIYPITNSIRLDGVHQPLVPNVDTFCDLVGVE